MKFVNKMNKKYIKNNYTMSNNKYIMKNNNNYTLKNNKYKKKNKN